MKDTTWYKIAIFVMLLVQGTTFAISQQKQTPAQQIQQLKNELATTQIILSDTKAERNAAVIEIARLNGLIKDQRDGILKSQRILQEAIDNDEKVDWKALNLAGWDLTLPDSTGKKPKGNSQ